PVRSEVLANLSQKSPVPHLFVLDRDERSKTEIDQLHKTLDRRCVFLAARELENYFLVPRALRDAVCSKSRDNAAVVGKAARTTDQEIAILIQNCGDNLYHKVLIRRIRSELPGLRGGLFTKEFADALAAAKRMDGLELQLRESLVNRVKEHLQSV